MAWAQITNVPISYRRHFFMRLLRKTFSDFWASSTFLQSREMPDPACWLLQHTHLQKKKGGGLLDRNVSGQKVHYYPMASPVHMEFSPSGTLGRCDPESTQLSASTFLRDRDSEQSIRRGTMAASGPGVSICSVQLWLLCTPFHVPEKRHLSLPWA